MGIARKIGLLAAAGAIYAAGVFTSERAQNIGFYLAHPRAQVEAGYCNIDGWHKEKTINENGSIETYLTNENGNMLPCLDGQISLQVGTIDYVAGNIKPGEQQRVVMSLYENLQPEEKKQVAKTVTKDYVSDEWIDFKEKMEQWWDNLIDKKPNGGN